MENYKLSVVCNFKLRELMNKWSYDYCVSFINSFLDKNPQIEPYRNIRLENGHIEFSVNASDAFTVSLIFYCKINTRFETVTTYVRWTASSDKNGFDGIDPIFGKQIIKHDNEYYLANDNALNMAIEQNNINLVYDLIKNEELDISKYGSRLEQLMAEKKYIVQPGNMVYKRRKME